MNYYSFIFRKTVLFFILIIGLLHADWEIINYERNEYVTLRSFCKFYKFNYPENTLNQEEITLKGASNQIKLRRESRSCLINGTKLWATLNIVRADQDWLISRKDVSKLFDPILRPYSLEVNSDTRGVVIDAGHGGDDRGAVSRKGVREKDCTLDTSIRLEKILKSRGISTVMTRRKDVFIELEERARIASRYSNYIFVSIHFNDASGSARGLETYCFPPLGGGSTEYEGRVFKRDSVTMPGNKSDLLNIFLANAIHQQIIKLYPQDEEADRGVKRARFVVLKENHLPAVLVEGGFLSNRTESGKISTPEYRQLMAEKIANGIEFYFNRGSQPEKAATVMKPIVPLPSTNTATINRSLTNQVPVISGTNVVKTVPIVKEVKTITPLKGTNVPLTVATNRISEVPPPQKLSPSSNEISIYPKTPSLYWMTNLTVSTPLYEQPFTLNSQAISGTNLPLQEEILEGKEPSSKQQESNPAKPVSPLNQRPEAQEEMGSAQEQPEVVIYMQNPTQVRTPKIDIRPIEVRTNAVSPEVKP